MLWSLPRGAQDTQRWLRDNLNPLFGWPSVARFSWGPALEVLDKNPQDHGAIEARNDRAYYCHHWLTAR